MITKVKNRVVEDLVKELDVLRRRLAEREQDKDQYKGAGEDVHKLSRAVEQSPSSIVITDTRGTIEYVNPKFTEVTGYRTDEVIGKNPRILKSGETPTKEYKRLWDTITSGGEWRGEFHNKKKNGELFWEFASISPIRNGKGVITHYLAVKEDITEKKKIEAALVNRVKELNCLFSISEIRGKKGISLDKILQEIVNIIPPSWQYPDITHAKIVLKDQEYRSTQFKEGKWEQKENIIVNGKEKGRIIVFYEKERPQVYEGPFLKEERNLLNAITERIGRVVEHIQAEEKLKDSQLKLQEQNMALEQKNIALKELILQIDREKNDIKNQVINNVDKIIKPTLKKLKVKRGSLACCEYIDILEKNLEELISPFGSHISRTMYHLTPMEIEICNLIKNGLKTKEIACTLSLSPLTVDTHRNNIRKKLKISKRGINLTSYLQALSD